MASSTASGCAPGCRTRVRARIITRLVDDAGRDLGAADVHADGEGHPSSPVGWRRSGHASPLGSSRTGSWAARVDQRARLRSASPMARTAAASEVAASARCAKTSRLHRRHEMHGSADRARPALGRLERAGRGCGRPRVGGAATGAFTEPALHGIGELDRLLADRAVRVVVRVWALVSHERLALDALLELFERRVDDDLLGLSLDHAEHRDLHVDRELVGHRRWTRRRCRRAGRHRPWP